MRTLIDQCRPEVILFFGSPEPPGKPWRGRVAQDTPHSEQSEIDSGLRWMRSCPVCHKRLVRQWPWTAVHCTCGWEWKG